jgi:alpha-tubulin suppressor-like RCC1 family protein
MACGGKHAVLVTRQGEVFSWGEESGGRLGHGVDCDVPYPQLVDALAATNTELVSCGEYHTCAVTLSGDLYTWGDGTHNFGLLGHGNDMSHWMPKRVNGSLEGVRVSSIACGAWHTALVTSAGQLFTFGDGTFGVLGHGDRKCASVPREVESLKGLKTVRAACGVWHTAAVVEVMVGYSSAINCSSGKLFTWGDGDKGRLGHGDKEQRLVPTCVAAVVDHNFRQVACGNSLTVALTTSGQVFTMGSTTYGQLGDPQADGKLPGLVEGKLWEAYVEDIACGAHHVAVLTHKSEVYTWGKGANGRLGHGDTEDRNLPTLVEALKDKQVKSIACGGSFMAAICLHKWLPGADQSACSGCRLPFSFTRKRHNCYHCGLVFCHACSSKRAPKAALAPNPGKLYRVCDSCSNKLKKPFEAGGVSLGILSRRGNVNQQAIELKETSVKADFKLPRPQLPTHAYPTSFDTVKQIEGKVGTKRMKKPESFSSRVSPAPSGFPSLSSWGNVNVPTTFKSEFKSSHSSKPKKSIVSSIAVTTPRAVSRAVSPLSRRVSPPRSTTPTPTISGLTTSKSIVEELKKTNEGLIEENLKLQSQVPTSLGNSMQGDMTIRNVVSVAY